MVSVTEGTDMAKDGSNRGGARPGAGRKKKSVTQRIAEAKSPIPLEDSVARLLGDAAKYREQPPTVKQLAHKVAYMEQELEFIKKIILASIEGK